MGDHQISGTVAEGIIYIFKVIEVHKQNGNGSVMTFKNSEFTITEFHEMSSVVQSGLFAQFGMAALTAEVFTDNPGSARVLEKTGRITSYNVCYTKLLRMPHQPGIPSVLGGEELVFD